MVPPPRRPARSTADTVAAVLLTFALVALCALGLLAALVPSLWAFLPICSDNCDDPKFSKFFDHTFTGAAVVVGGEVIAVGVAGIGMAVAGVRRSVLWIWPAIGAAIVVAAFVAALSIWINGIPSGH
ncbi:hypothetical protein A5725_11550 [Mycobacterium kubicae]|uniref:hypothetical protein n=1 Tax=Mycobacterium kubicae TaxID=120959 RepID=UPI0007FFECA8|nr:hypothetical protein [Mycobacterium kubicae]OBF22837.1 hypothetical protein A5725_11550 [Mycobacterium kubicae]